MSNVQLCAYNTVMSTKQHNSCRQVLAIMCGIDISDVTQLNIAKLKDDLSTYAVFQKRYRIQYASHEDVIFL